MYQRCILHVVVDPRSAVALPGEAVVRFHAALVLRGPQRRTGLRSRCRTGHATASWSRWTRLATQLGPEGVVREVPHF